MPRQVSMYLCREIISTPLKNIGKARIGAARKIVA